MWVYKYLFETLLSIILGIYPELELVDYMIVLLCQGSDALFPFSSELGQTNHGLSIYLLTLSCFPFGAIVSKAAWYI